MTAIQYIEHLLRNNWEVDVPGRAHQVPQPEIIAQNRDEKSVRTSTHDVIEVQDGGSESHEYAGLGGAEKDVTSLVTIEIRTSHSVVRFVGGRDEDNEDEAWGGLQGEVERILGRHDFDDKEFSYVHAYEWNDQRGQVKWGHYKGTWEVRLEQVGIDFEPPASS